MLYLLALLIGVITGLRTMTALAAISWAMRLGHLGVQDGWLAVFGYRWTPWLFTLLALGEFVTDQLPMTPSRRTPPQAGARIVIGALCGAAIGMAGGHAVIAAAIGIVGAVIGTRFGAAARTNLARAFVNDHPAALLEDVVAVAAAALVVVAL